MTLKRNCKQRSQGGRDREPFGKNTEGQELGIWQERVGGCQRAYRFKECREEMMVVRGARFIT